MAGASFAASTMAKTISLTKPLIFWVLLLLFMNLTRPSQLPVLFLVVPYALLWSAFFYTITMIFELIMATTDRVAHPVRIRHIAVVIATGGLCFVALQSIGQLTLRDVIVVSLLIVIGYFYFNRNHKGNH